MAIHVAIGVAIQGGAIQGMLKYKHLAIQGVAIQGMLKYKQGKLVCNRYRDIGVAVGVAIQGMLKYKQGKLPTCNKKVSFELR